jgi:cytochrome c biogenesis protein CcdA
MKRDPPGGALGAAGLGAGIMLAELPTAIPYFAALAAIVGSSASLLVQLELVALFNVAVILPLLAIVGVLLLAGRRSQRLLDRTRGALDRYIGVVLPIAVGLLAVALFVTGVVGLIRS